MLCGSSLALPPFDSLQLSPTIVACPVGQVKRASLSVTRLQNAFDLFAIDAAEVHLGGFQPLAARSLHSSRTPSFIIRRAKLLSVSMNFRCMGIKIDVAVFCRLAPSVRAKENHLLRVQGCQGVLDPRLQLVRKLDRARGHACILSTAGIPRQARSVGRSDGSRTLWGRNVIRDETKGRMIGRKEGGRSGS